MKNVKNIAFKILRRLIFSLFLATILFAVFFQKIQTQIVGIEKVSKNQLIKNLQEQVDIQKTQLDNIKTNLENLRAQISQDEESSKTIDAQKDLRKQMAAGKEEIKGPVVDFLAQQPEFSSDEEIVTKFSGAKKAMEKHEQEFVSKLESKKEEVSAQPSTAEPTKEPVKEEPKQEAIKEEVTPTEPAPIAEPAQEIKPIEETKTDEAQPISSPEVQTILKELPKEPVIETQQPTAIEEQPEKKAEEALKAPEVQPEMIPTQPQAPTLPTEKPEETRQKAQPEA